MDTSTVLAADYCPKRNAQVTPARLVEGAGVPRFEAAMPTNLFKETP
jgi:hypothetical protein